MPVSQNIPGVLADLAVHPEFEVVAFLLGNHLHFIVQSLGKLGHPVAQENASLGPEFSHQGGHQLPDDIVPLVG